MTTRPTFMHPVVSLVLSSQDQLWCDPAPVVRGEGFIPGTEVRVTCACEDGSGLVWKSENGFLVSPQSSFDTGATPGFGDDYYGVAAEGPIYSVHCQEGIHRDFVLPENGEVQFTFEVFAGRVRVWFDSVNRLCSSKASLLTQRYSGCALRNSTPEDTGLHCGRKIHRPQSTKSRSASVRNRQSGPSSPHSFRPVQRSRSRIGATCPEDCFCDTLFRQWATVHTLDNRGP